MTQQTNSDAVASFREMAQREFHAGELNNHFDRLHLLLYSQGTILREWIEISPSTAQETTPSSTDNNGAVADLSLALANHINEFVRQNLASGF